MSIASAASTAKRLLRELIGLHTPDDKAELELIRQQLEELNIAADILRAEADRAAAAVHKHRTGHKPSRH